MLLGIFMAAALGLNLGAMCIYLYVLVLLRFIMPIPAWRTGLSARIDAVIDHAVDVNRWLMNKRLLGEVEVTWAGDERLARDKWFLLIPNHQSWVDIILLQNFMREHVPPLKFFNKQVLIWLPLVGLAMHFLGFPYLKRYSREQIARRPELKQVDQARMSRAIEIFEKRPTGIMIFAEGTRFTTEKHAHQASPYRYLLNPRTGGVAAVLGRLGTRLEAVLDVTIVYPKGRPGFWDLLSGRMGAAKFDVRALPVPPFAAAQQLDDEDALRQATHDWLSEIWRARDARIHALMEAQ